MVKEMKTEVNDEIKTEVKDESESEVNIEIKTAVDEECQERRSLTYYLRKLCCMFCCPPCSPSNITNNLAFCPPEEPTYSIEDEDKLILKEEAKWLFSDSEKENLEVFYTRTARGNRMACMFVRCVPYARFTILYSNPNAVDLGQMSSFYLGLGRRIDCNIFSYDYSGYGAR